ncbi:MAG TPA: nucleoside triphosphate pyrophosphatase [Alphaproteobacteria bacterium]|nr:nucleoside triphosphate pyrophosphatase [Alphaproteobacteria bacterium]
MPSPHLTLASSSPRRLALLESIGIAPDKILAAEIDETPKSKELPRKLAQRLARAKLEKIAAQEPQGFILAADTVVACGRRILPKAESADDVRACLKFLSGRRHHVYTAVALRAPNGKITERLADSVVAFRQLSPSGIEAYAKCGEGIGKAGGYAIQGRAAALIRFMSGSYSNIVGLPLFEVAQMLKGCGWREEG